MPHVPRPGHSRRTHGRVARASHDHSGYLPPLTGAEQQVDQTVIDGVIGPGAIPPGTLDGDAVLVPGSLSSTPFADEIRPVGIVDALPTLPDEEYPIGSLVVLTSDIKVYRNDSDVWTKTLDGLDLIADTVTAGAIAAGAIGATEIAAQAISVKHLFNAAGNLQPNPGFENENTALGGAITGWVADEAGDLAHMQTVGVAHLGALALRITQPSTATSLALATDGYIPAAPGGRYRLRVWTRGDSGNSATAQARMRIREYDVAKSQITSASVFVNVGTSTTYQALTTIRTLNAATVYIRLELVNDDSAGTGSQADDLVYFDDVELYRTDGDVNHAGGDVSITSDGVTITNGKLVVSNAGATVIIDGTSNMFKIQGEIRSPGLTWPAVNTETSATTINFGGGSLSSLPTVIPILTRTDTGKSQDMILDFDAATGVANTYAKMHYDLNSGSCRMNVVRGCPQTVPGGTIDFHGFILKEDAL